MRRIELDFKLQNKKGIKTDRVANNGENLTDEDFEIFDVEGFECRMTDMEERERSDESRSGSG